MFEELNAISISINDKLYTGSGLAVEIENIEIVSDDNYQGRGILHVEVMVTYLAWDKENSRSRCKCNYESFCNLIRS